jgi:hypothetical protein
MGDQIRVIILVVATLFSFEVAQASRTAIIAVEGAMVYKKPDFDSAVIGYMPRGKKVKVSTKSFGPFQRVGFREGVMGFISDVDIVTEEGVPFSVVNSGEDPGKKEAASGEKSGEKPAKGKKKKKRSGPEKIYRKKPVATADAIGVAVGYIAYKELVSRREFTENIIVYGLKYTTRAPFLMGPYGLDVTLLFKPSPPSYYQTALGTSAKGMYIFFDAVWTFPLTEFMGKDGMMIAGIGPLVTYSEAKATLPSGVDFKQTDLVVGASLQLGAAIRFSPIILKCDAKYYLDKNSYLGFLGSMQYEF